MTSVQWIVMKVRQCIRIRSYNVLGVTIVHRESFGEVLFCLGVFVYTFGAFANEMR